LTAEISSIFKVSLPLCPSCRGEISSDDRFCQECGAALAPIAGPYIDSEPIGADPIGSESIACDPVGLDAVGTGAVPHLPRLKMERLHPSLAKPVIALPIVGVLVVSLALIPFFLMGFEKSYSGFSNHYVIEQASQAYKENRFDEAATILERLSISHKLDDDQCTFLSDVYLARAEQRVGRSDYVGAMSDLDKIPPHYSKFLLVTGKKNELAELIKVQQAQLQAQATAAAKNHLKSSDNSRLRLAAKTPVPSSTEAIASAPPAISGSTRAALQPVRSESIPARLESMPAHSEPALAHSESISAGSESMPAHSESTPARSGSPPARSESRSVRSDLPPARSESTASRFESSKSHLEFSTTASESQPSSSEPAASRIESKVQKGSGKSKVAKITENDQVRYNELLAGYFSQEHKVSGANEPPSLKEWIDNGRPKF